MCPCSIYEAGVFTGGEKEQQALSSCTAVLPQLFVSLQNVDENATQGPSTSCTLEIYHVVLMRSHSGHSGVCGGVCVCRRRGEERVDVGQVKKKAERGVLDLSSVRWSPCMKSTWNTSQHIARAEARMLTKQTQRHYLKSTFVGDKSSSIIIEKHLPFV